MGIFGILDEEMYDSYLLSLLRYMDKYGKNYSSDERKYIFETFCRDLEVPRSDIMNQIYSHLEMVPSNKNIYDGFLDILNQYYDLSKRILEIGAGYYPALGEKIVEQQERMHKGTLTIYDPVLVIDKLKHATLFKKEFNNKDSLDIVDLVISIMPCSCTEMVIDRCAAEKKDMFLALCTCYPKTKHFKQTEDWWNYLYFRIKNQLAPSTELCIDYLENDYLHTAPIITTHHQKSLRYKTYQN